MKYFVFSDQDQDWDPVVKKFVEDYTERGWLCKSQGCNFLGESGGRYYVSDLAKTQLQIDDPRTLFNFWYNQKRLQSNEQKS